MLKFEREFVERMLLYLLLVKGQGTDITHIWRWVGRDWYRQAVAAHDGGLQGAPSQRLIETVRELIDAERAIAGEHTEIGDMIDHIVDQLEGYEQAQQKGTNSGTLIDKMAEVLKQTYVRNVLSGKTLELLRKAILIPSELAGLEKRLYSKEMSCSGCGHKFSSGEVGTFCNEARPDRNGYVVTIHCTACTKPSYIACDAPECDICLPIPPKANGFFRKENLCQQHQEEKKQAQKRAENGAAAQAPAMPAPPQPGVFTRAAAQRMVIEPPPTITWNINGVPNIRWTEHFGMPQPNPVPVDPFFIDTEEDR